MNKAYVLTAALIALALLSGCNAKESQAKLPDQPPPGKKTAALGEVQKSAETAAPDAGQEEPREYSRTSALTGTLLSHRTSTLTPQVSGAVGKVHVRAGMTVKKGAPLVTLKQEDFALRVRQAEAMLEAAKVQLDSAKLQWTRLKTLVEDKAAPQNQFDLIDAQYRGAQAGLEQARVALEMAQKAKRDSRITAPYPGLITARHVSEGEYASVMPATRLVTIEENDILDLHVQVPETELNRLKPGDPIKITFSAIGDTRQEKITRIVHSLNRATRTFTAIAELDNKDGSLSSGMFAEVQLLDRNAE